MVYVHNVPRIDLIGPDTCRIWFQIEGCDGVSRCGVGSCGIDPHEANPDSWYSWVQDAIEIFIETATEPEDWDMWGLRQGIALYQPFLVELRPPVYSRCGEYGMDVDVDFDFDIIAALRWPNTRTVDTLDRLCGLPFLSNGIWRTALL